MVSDAPEMSMDPSASPTVPSPTPTLEDLQERVAELEAEAAAERRRAFVAGESLKILFKKYRAANGSSSASPPPSPAPPTYAADVNAEMDRLRARIAELEARPSPPTPAPPSSHDDRISSLEKRIDTLEGELFDAREEVRVLRAGLPLPGASPLRSSELMEKDAEIERLRSKCAEQAVEINTHLSDYDAVRKNHKLRDWAFLLKAQLTAHGLAIVPPPNGSSGSASPVASAPTPLASGSSPSPPSRGKGVRWAA